MTGRGTWDETVVKALTNDPVLFRQVMQRTGEFTPETDEPLGRQLHDMVVSGMDTETNWTRVARALRQHLNLLHTKAERRDRWVREAAAGETDEGFEQWYAREYPNERVR